MTSPSSCPQSQQYPGRDQEQASRSLPRPTSCLTWLAFLTSLKAKWLSHLWLPSSRVTNHPQLRASGGLERPMEVRLARRAVLVSAHTRDAGRADGTSKPPWPSCVPVGGFSLGLVTLLQGWAASATQGRMHAQERSRFSQTVLQFLSSGLDSGDNVGRQASKETRGLLRAL